MFLNPPYAAAIIKPFVAKLVQSYVDGDVTEAILLTNNATDTRWFAEAATACSAMCTTRGRISFLQARDGQLIEGTSPTNGQVFTYFGPSPGRFADVFGRLGIVWAPMRTCPPC